MTASGTVPRTGMSLSPADSRCGNLNAAKDLIQVRDPPLAVQLELQVRNRSSPPSRSDYQVPPGSEHRDRDARADSA